jgi:hypothetical protein
MLPLSIFTWWYGPGWAGALQSTRRMLTGISHEFSVAILIRTLFAPWRRIVTYPGAGLDAKLRAMGDNIVSRAAGFFVRTLVLLTAFLISIGAIVLGIAAIIVWPLVPPAVVALFVKGLIG